MLLDSDVYPLLTSGKNDQVGMIEQTIFSTIIKLNDTDVAVLKFGTGLQHQMAEKERTLTKLNSVLHGFHNDYLDFLLVATIFSATNIWAATWQNQQNGCAPSEDSDQPGHPPSLIRVFAVRMKKAWALSYPLSAQQDSDQTGRMPRLIWVFAGNTLILSCRGSYVWVYT